MLADAPQFARAHQCLAIVSSQAVLACAGRAAVGLALVPSRVRAMFERRRPATGPLFLALVRDWVSPSMGVPPAWRPALSLCQCAHFPLRGRVCLGRGPVRPVAKGFARLAADSELSLTLGIRLSN